MVTIIFESNAATFDEENNIASGWHDVHLSPKGIEEAKQLGKRQEGEQYSSIFCSDLKRAYQTATLAFNFDPKMIKSDWRLRECDYGLDTQSTIEEVAGEKAKHLDVPFADGESYAQCMERMASFLADIKAMYEGKQIMVVGHEATYFGLEHFINNKPLGQCISEGFQKIPARKYQLN